MEEIVRNYHSEAILAFRKYKQLAERAIEQLDDDEFFASIDDESNSVALLLKHMAGNLHSRWSDFLTTDGEKPDRQRDTEFELIGDTRESLMQFWESGWNVLFRNVEPLTLDYFKRTVTIRGEPHTIVDALNRQLTHYSYHVGQIVFLSKHLKASKWKTLSIPKKQSAQFNQFLAEKQFEGEIAGDRYESVEKFHDRAGR